MSTASPYRTHPRPISTLTVAPVSLPRPLLILAAVILLAPALLHVFLWSRVVTIRCVRGGGERVTCDVKESSLALSGRAKHDATGARRAVLRGAVHTSRGDASIALVGPAGERPLTSGFNGDKAGQQAAADQLTDFLASPQRPSITLAFGSRWRTAWILMGMDGALFLCFYPFVGQRLRLRADRGRDTLEVSRGLWPLLGRPVVMPLSRLARFTIAEEAPRRFRLVAVMSDEQVYPLTWALGQSPLFEGAAEKLNAWMTQERERHADAS